jgi:hypothetical protein
VDALVAATQALDALVLPRYHPGILHTLQGARERRTVNNDDPEQS